MDNDGVRVGNSADDFGRTTEVKTSYTGTDDFKTLYTYRTQQNSNITTNNIHTITQKHGDTELLKYYYFYDEDGNISGVSETTNKNESFEEYYYDWLSQLKTVIDRQNNTYTLFQYDDGGNLSSVEKRHYDTYSNQLGPQISTNTYTYGDNNWKDKLTAFNGQVITYDAMGNPLQYRDNLSFEWENGRQLKKVTNNNTTIAMRYDSNGLRTQKGSVRYYYDSDNNLIAMVKGNNTLFFYYDENGSATSFSLNGAMYFYVKNLQGDIVNIADSNGNVQVRYDYDVFGKITAVKNGSNQAITDTSSLAFLNPLRYRGYVYDDETGLYYLQSRYYDPVTGRFLNADVYADTETGSPLSTNMFAYCENNLLYRIDVSGTDAYWIQSPSSAGTNGHTSLLLHDKRRAWWYFFWSGDYIQMLFLGNGPKISELNRVVERTLIMFERVYNISIPKYDEYYESSLCLKGDFTKSIDWILSYMINSTGKKYFLQFNLFSSNNDYIMDYYYPSRLKKLSTHTRWKNITRPSSMIVTFSYKNPYYNLLKNNCMQMSSTVLLKGKFTKDDYYYRKVLKLFENVSIPNHAYGQIYLFKLMSDNNNAYWGYYYLKLYQSVLNYYGVNWLRNKLSPCFWFINI